MNGIEFERRMSHLLRGCSQKNIKRWISWAEECTEEGQYVDFVECPKNKAISAWLDSYYASIYFIKQEFGADIAKQIIDLSDLPLCLYPYEMRNTAKLLRDKATVERIFQAIEDGSLVSDEKLPTMQDVKIDLHKKRNRER